MPRRGNGPTSPRGGSTSSHTRPPRAPLTPVDAALDAATPAALIYTSGTTGPAKGAVITHGNLCANARMLVDAWRFTAGDRLLLALPLFHVHGLGNGVHCWLLSGCRTRLLERFESASAAATLRDFRPSVFFGVPTMYVRLLEVDRSEAREIGGAFRLCVSGSAPLPAQVLQDFEALFGQRILERYGMTETLMTLGNPYDGERRAGTVGLPFAGVSIRLDRRTGTRRRATAKAASCWSSRRPSAPATGIARTPRRRRLWTAGSGPVTSPSVRPTATSRCAAAAATWSSPAASTSTRARSKNCWPNILRSPRWLSPACPTRSAARCRWRLSWRAPMPSPMPTALIAHCRSQLASFKVPRRVVFLDRLPRTALGKVQKQRLSELLTP